MATNRFQCSSASRKFLNAKRQPDRDDRQLFQCSSASRKFLNRRREAGAGRVRGVSVLFSEPKIPQPCAALWSTVLPDVGFSALQRAENSSTHVARARHTDILCFSALQRAENSSTRRQMIHPRDRIIVSVLFSEPKIPQPRPLFSPASRVTVSVLFSEPKIPQRKSV